jgi:hypothetical protein
VRASWRAEPEQPPYAVPAAMTEIATGVRWELDPDIAAWLVEHGEPLAVADLATLWLGPLRPRLEAMVAARGATLLVPLLDRGALVAVIEASHQRALREDERGVVAESARAAARALTYVQLSRAAAREGATARELEVAEAMRRQTSARSDGELGPWLVAAAYRSAARTTGAAWSASLLEGGRLALLVTEGQAHGVVAALATAALTGAFAAATAVGAPGVDEHGGGDLSGDAGRGDGPRAIDAHGEAAGQAAIGVVVDMAGKTPRGIDELVAILRASAEDALRGDAPVSGFVAVLDPEAGAISWACAGHPGAAVVSRPDADEPVARLGGGGDRLGVPRGTALRGEAILARGATLVVASRGTQGGDPDAWLSALRAHATAGPALASALVDAAAERGQTADDLLAVVIRPRQALPS